MKGLLNLSLNGHHKDVTTDKLKTKKQRVQDKHSQYYVKVMFTSFHFNGLTLRFDLKAE